MYIYLVHIAINGILIDLISVAQRYGSFITNMESVCSRKTGWNAAGA